MFRSMLDPERGFPEQQCRDAKIQPNRMDDQERRDSEHVADDPENTPAAAEAEPTPSGSELEEVSAPAEETMPEGEAAADTMAWYVLKVTSNREKSVKASLERRIKREGADEFFGEIVIPTQKVVDAKGGKKRVLEQKRFPGYMMIQMELNDESWHLVRDTTGVADFTGAAGRPIAMEPHEVEQMLGIQHDEDSGTGPTKVKIDLEIGEIVKIKDGPFESFEGSVETIDETHGKISVLIEIFGRPTPTVLDYWQVEKL